MLVVMEHRDVHPLFQCLLDDEAVGGGDVLEVDAAEARLEQSDRVDEFLGIFGRDFDVDRIDVGEALEQHRFAFHHRLGRERAQIAHAEDRGAVGDDRDEVALGGQLIGAAGVVGDRLHRHRDAGRIGETEVALRRHRLGGDDLDFPRPSARVILDRFGFREFDVALAHAALPGAGFSQRVWEESRIAATVQPWPEPTNRPR